MKRKALAKSGVIAAKQDRYNPPDDLLAFLKVYRLLCIAIQRRALKRRPAIHTSRDT